jgi:hypothetical protein
LHTDRSCGARMAWSLVIWYSHYRDDDIRCYKIIIVSGMGIVPATLAPYSIVVLFWIYYQFGTYRQNFFVILSFFGPWYVCQVNLCLIVMASKINFKWIKLYSRNLYSRMSQHSLSVLIANKIFKAYATWKSINNNSIGD